MHCQKIQLIEVYHRSKLVPIVRVMGVDDSIFEIVSDYTLIEGLRGMSRDERQNKWKELIRIVEEEIRSAVECEEERICEEEENCSSGDDESMSISSSGGRRT